MIELLLLYIIIGFIHMFIITLIIMHIKKLGSNLEFTNLEKIFTILVWPVFSFVFWYNFIRNFLDRR